MTLYHHRLFRQLKKKQFVIFVLILMCICFYSSRTIWKNRIPYDETSSTSINLSNSISDQYILTHIAGKLPVGKTFKSYPLEVDLWHIIKNNDDPSVIKTVPINPANFKFIIQNEDKCASTTGPINLLLIIKSHINNYIRRSAIRMTWGQETGWPKWNVRLVFSVGTTNDSDQNHIQKENEEFKDILQHNFKDAYFNNTYKTIMGLRWAAKYCSIAEHLFFLDDDFFVNPLLVMKYLSDEKIKSKKYFIAGYKQAKAEVIRSNEGYYAKNRVPYSEISWKFWPPFVSAGAWLVNRELARAISIATKYTQYFRMDDVFIAIILHKLGIEPLEIRSIDCNIDSKVTMEKMAVHGVGMNEMLKSWKQIKF